MSFVYRKLQVDTFFSFRDIMLKVFWALNSRCQVNDSTCQKGTNLSSDIKTNFTVHALLQHHETSLKDYLEMASWPEILYIQNSF